MFFGGGFAIQVLIIALNLAKVIEKYKDNLLVTLKKYEKELMIEVDVTAKEVLRVADRVNQTKSMNALGEVSSALAHEINNPLAIVSGNIKRISRNINVFNKDDNLSNDFIDTKIESMSISIEKIAEIIKSIYFFSTDDAKLITMEKIRLEEIFDPIIILVNSKYKNISIVYSSIPENIYVYGNHTELKRAYLNIIMNSIDSIENDDEGLIYIKYHDVGDSFILDIIDSGTGILPSDMKNVFEPLFTSKESLGHSGLGLSISEKNIKLCHGEIYCFIHKEGKCFIRTKFKKYGYSDD